MFEIDTHRVILQLLDGEGSGSTESVINSLISIFLLTVGVLSLCGSLFIIVSFLLLKDWSFPNNLIFVLSLCDFFWTGTYFALFNLQGGLCVFQAVWGSFWGLATTFWTFFMAFTYWSQFSRFKIEIYRRGPYIFHGITWTLSFILAVAPVFTHDYNPNGITRNIPRCWLQDSKDLARFWAYYIWVMLVMVAIAVMYTDLILKLRRSSVVQQRVDTFSVRWYLYPAIYWGVWIVPCILRILEQAYPDRNFDVLVLVQSITMPMQGFLNCLVYGIRTSLIERIKAARQTPTDEKDRARLLPHRSDILEDGIFDDSALPLSINTNADVDFTRPIVNSYDRFSDSPHIN